MIMMITGICIIAALIGFVGSGNSWTEDERTAYKKWTDDE